ncbi:hypothetical protein [Arthrobacter methylotrophus]|uniref:hypothetical protein n=1 Tax=Arthrobacter methylotrophus TaxID=121291 RepID=UPI0031F07CC0
MIVGCLVLTIVGFVIPVAAAVVAYTRFYPQMPDPAPNVTTTYDDVERWMKHDIPELFRSRKAALKWPALWAGFGLLCSTAASVLSLLVPPGS